ncbi:MAG: hypothetical protein Q8P67_07130 [archaeon]|nr:hypothetical protein [archaeon]
MKICSSTDPKITEYLQHQASIQLRRVIRQTWLHTPESLEKRKKSKALTVEEFQEQEDERDANPLWDVIISESEKKAVREAIFPVLINSPAGIFRQLIDAFKFISGSDYPAKWPGIFAEIGRVLKGTKVCFFQTKKTPFKTKINTFFFLLVIVGFTNSFCCT